MKRLSSFKTVVSKRIFPVLWFGIFALVSIGAVVDGKLSTQPLFFVGPVLAVAIGYLFWRTLASDLADDVLDFGDHLVVKRGSTKDRIDLSNIMKVDASSNTSPERMTLHLVKPSRFGAFVSFNPVAGKHLNPFTKNSLAEDLMLRAQDARSKNAG